MSLNSLAEGILLDPKHVFLSIQHITCEEKPVTDWHHFWPVLLFHGMELRINTQ